MKRVLTLLDFRLPGAVMNFPPAVFVLIAIAPVCIAITGCKLTPDPTIKAAVDKLFKQHKDKYENGDYGKGDGPALSKSVSDDFTERSRASSNKIQLDLWNDPDFQKRFAESYIAETEIEPKVTEDERKMMMEVMDLMDDNKLDQAARLLERKRGGGNALFDFTYGQTMFQKDNFDAAVEAYKMAVDIHPKFRRAWRNMGISLVRLERYQEAIKALTKVIELGGDEAIIYGLLGYCYSSTGDSLCAESAYRMAILLNPGQVDWKLGLVQSFFRQQRYAEAIAVCDRLILDNPENADPWLWQANAYIGMDKPFKAAENYEFVDQLGKSTYQSLSTMGNIYVNEGLYERAVDCYVRAMKKKPEAKIDRVLNAAKVLTANSAYEQTERLLKHLKEIRGERLQSDDRKELLKLQARIAVARGKAGEHVRILEQIIDIDPKDGGTLLLLGQHYARTNEPQQAIFCFERAADIKGFEADAKVQHAQLLVKEKKYDEAMSLLEKAQQIRPRQNVGEYLKQIKLLAKSK